MLCTMILFHFSNIRFCLWPLGSQKFYFLFISLSENYIVSGRKEIIKISLLVIWVLAQTLLLFFSQEALEQVSGELQKVRRYRQLPHTDTLFCRFWPVSLWLEILEKMPKTPNRPKLTIFQLSRSKFLENDGFWPNRYTVVGPNTGTQIAEKVRYFSQISKIFK